MTVWVGRQYLDFCSLHETHLHGKRLKIKDREKIYPENDSLRKTYVAILLSKKIGFKIRKSIRDRDSHSRIIELNFPKKA